MAKPSLIDLTGVVRLRRDLIAEGYTDKQIAVKVKTGALVRVRRGAYVSGPLWTSLSKEDRHRVLSRAVLRTAHPDTVLTHVSAAIEHRAPVWGISLDKVHTTRRTRPERAGRREDDWVPHRGKLPDWEVEIVNGVPVSIPVRTAVELTTIAGVEQSLVSVNGMLHADVMAPEDFAAFAKKCHYWPHTLTTDLVVRLADPRMESIGETRTDHLCWAEHLPRPQPQVVIVDEQGREFARVDFAWPECGVFLEFDGKEKYFRFRRRDESLEDFLMREKKREERICALTGWVCIRITWADLEQPRVTAARIRRILESRTSRTA